jgi:hypothetical protein
MHDHSGNSKEEKKVIGHTIGISYPETFIGILRFIPEHKMEMYEQF